jgi:hypothetical protein
MVNKIFNSNIFWVMSYITYVKPTHDPRNRVQLLYILCFVVTHKHIFY